VADKATRARSIQAMASMGKVFFPKNAAWKGDVLNQLLRFPAGKHDDSVDVFGLIGRGLEFIRAPRSARQSERSEHVDFGGAGWMS
jgi:hypothetical protein